MTRFGECERDNYRLGADKWSVCVGEKGVQLRNFLCLCWCVKRVQIREKLFRIFREFYNRSFGSRHSDARAHTDRATHRRSRRQLTSRSGKVEITFLRISLCSHYALNRATFFIVSALSGARIERSAHLRSIARRNYVFRYVSTLEAQIRAVEGDLASDDGNGTHSEIGRFHT